MVSAGFMHTVLLRSDGSAVAIGEKFWGQCDIPPLDEGIAYAQISAGKAHTVLLRSDGNAVAVEESIPPLNEGIAYAQISAGEGYTVLLRSDGSAVAVGTNSYYGQCDIPPLDEGIAYAQVSAGAKHTVLLRSDGSAFAVGTNSYGQCDIPPLDEGIAYAQVSAGFKHTVLLKSDGSAVAVGDNSQGQCNIPLPELGICYASDLTCGRDLALQLELVGEDDAITLVCSTLAGEERFRLSAQGVDSAWETHKKIAHELKINLPNLQLILPDGQLLATICRANPGASVAEVTQSTQHPQP